MSEKKMALGDPKRGKQGTAEAKTRKWLTGPSSIIFWPSISSMLRRNAIALMAKEKDSCTTTSPDVEERND